MKKLVLFAIVFFIAGISTQPAMALMTYTGSLSTPTGITATAPWSDGLNLTWIVNENANGSWTYTYQFTDGFGNAPAKQISHMVIAISPDATRNDFWDASGPIEIQTWSGDDPSNPGMPGEIFGVKIDIAGDEYHITSSKAPVWGDFYIKDGTLDNNPVYAYNSTFGTPDPDDPPADGSINYKILRPDSITTMIPEPSTLLLFGSALAFAGGIRRFRRK
jgi:hypothetical protein